MNCPQQFMYMVSARNHCTSAFEAEDLGIPLCADFESNTAPFRAQYFIFRFSLLFALLRDYAIVNYN